MVMLPCVLKRSVYWSKLAFVLEKGYNNRAGMA